MKLNPIPIPISGKYPLFCVGDDDDNRAVWILSKIFFQSGVQVFFFFWKLYIPDVVPLLFSILFILMNKNGRWSFEKFFYFFMEYYFIFDSRKEFEKKEKKKGSL